MRQSFSSIKCPLCDKYNIVERDKKYEQFKCENCGETVQYGCKSESVAPGIIHNYNPSAKLPSDYKTFLDNLNPVTRSM